MQIFGQSHELSYLIGEAIQNREIATLGINQRFAAVTGGHNPLASIKNDPVCVRASPV